MVSLCPRSHQHDERKHSRLMAGSRYMEEKRRLCYVGVTRTVDNLTILRPSFAHGRHTEPSRYLITADAR